MRDIRSSRANCQAEISRRIKELERERREALADYEQYEKTDWFRISATRQINEAYDGQKARAVNEVYNSWHNDQMYHLIYADGSEVVISAEDILGGEKLPRLTGIVYAELSSADDHFDTETGDLFWYAEERMQACGYDYDAEDERRWRYETAIQYKYGTTWSKFWSIKHPEFVPPELVPPQIA